MHQRVILSEAQRSRRIPQNISNASSRDYSTSLGMTTPALNIYLLATEEFHDIAPPVDYSLIPPWLVFVIAFVVLSLLGLVVWWFAQRRKSELPPKAPREIALEELEQIRGEIERMSPYQFSIRVSDILRRYVTQQYGRAGNATNFHRVSHRNGKGAFVFGR